MPFEITTGRHFEESAHIPASPKEVYDYVDDHSRFSSHMSESSWMMGGGKMNIEVDEGLGQKVGSHIRLSGKVFGLNLYLDEVVILHDPPRKKVWETVGNPRLLIIGNNRMGLEISEESKGSRLKVFIDYDLPKGGTRWLGRLFGRMYAKWCVGQMLRGAEGQFKNLPL